MKLNSPEENFTVVAPTRADLAGGTIDLWPLYTFFEGGKTINVALSLCARVHFSYSEGTKNNILIYGMGSETANLSRPLSLEESMKLPGSCQFPAYVISSFLKRETNHKPINLKIKIESDAPPRSGLGGSSTLCVALTRGLGKISREFVSEGWRWELMSWARDVEAAFLKVPTGTQDYLAALYGNLNCYHSKNGGIVQTAYEEAVFNELSERVVILYSGEMHHSGLSNWEVFKGAVEKKEEVLKGFIKLKKIADTMDEKLREKQVDWTLIGELISEEWTIRRETFQVHTPKLDEIVAWTRQQNILGVKVCGAAQGGCLLALVDPAHRQSFVENSTKHGIKVLQTTPQLLGVRIDN